MPDWKIVIADGLSDNGMAVLRAAAQVDDLSGCTVDELLQHIPGQHALLVGNRTRVTARVFAAASDLRVIGRAGAGVENIDLAAASARRVTVVNAPLSASLAAAEHTLALFLALARSTPRADASLKAGEWIKKDLEGIELYGRVLGIIGVDEIACQVAQRVAALGMQVLGYDPFVPAGHPGQTGIRRVELNDLFTRADFISLHLPTTPETRRLINGQALAMMKPGVRLVCISSGGLIDETALLGALETGQVAGAGLDAFGHEPPGLSALASHPRVIATPRISAQTVEAWKRASLDIAEEVLAALDGRELRWKVV